MPSLRTNSAIVLGFKIVFVNCFSFIMFSFKTVKICVEEAGNYGTFNCIYEIVFVILKLLTISLYSCNISLFLRTPCKLTRESSTIFLTISCKVKRFYFKTLFSSFKKLVSFLKPSLIITLSSFIISELSICYVFDSG